MCSSRSKTTSASYNHTSAIPIVLAFSPMFWSAQMPPRCTLLAQRRIPLTAPSVLDKLQYKWQSCLLSEAQLLLLVRKSRGVLNVAHDLNVFSAIIFAVIKSVLTCFCICITHCGLPGQDCTAVMREHRSRV